jgi:hypothetical protein
VRKHILAADENTQEQTFAQRLKELMARHDPPLGGYQLAPRIAYSYEAVRRVTTGKQLPGPHFVHSVASLFGVDEAELQAIAKRDKFLREFGLDPDTAIFDPRLRPVLKAWPLLTDDQKAAMKSLQLNFLRENLARARKRRDDLLADQTETTPDEQIP